MKIEAIIQQDAVTVDVDEDTVTITITQRSSSDGSESSIWITGRANVEAVIAALQQAREAMQ